MSKYGPYAGFTTAFTREREASADRSRVYHSLRQNFSVKFISLSRKYGGKPVARESTGKPVARFQTKGSRVKKHFPTEKIFFFWNIKQVLGSNEPLCRFSDPEDSMKSFLEEHKDYMLAEAKSEVRKQEWRADVLDSSVRDLQRQLDSNRLEINCTNQGYEEYRKEQARLHEELSLARKSTSRNSNQKYS